MPDGCHRRDALRMLGAFGIGVCGGFAFLDSASADFGSVRKTFEAKITGENFVAIGSPTGIYTIDRLSGDTFSAALDVTTIVPTEKNYLHDTYKTMFIRDGAQYHPVAEWKKTHHKIDGVFRGEVETKLLFDRTNMVVSLARAGSTPFKSMRYSVGDVTPFILLARIMGDDISTGLHACILNFQPADMWRAAVKVIKTKKGFEIVAPVDRSAPLSDKKRTVSLKRTLNDDGTSEIIFKVPEAPRIHMIERRSTS